MARILDVTPDEYHQLEHLSSSLAKELIARSPAHARARRGKAPSTRLDRGTIIHRLVLGKGKDYVAIDADDWRTKAAKEARDAAREQGLVPVLAGDLEGYEQAAAAIVRQLGARGIVLDGASEVAIEWHEGDVLCRAMLDHVWLDRGVILDLKITEDAAPDRVERTAENLGYAIQSTAYTRALTALRPEHVGRVDFVFAFCEPEEPYAINLQRPGGAFRELGERRWHRAVQAWGECLKTGTWPSYGDGFINPPEWALKNEDYAA